MNPTPSCMDPMHYCFSLTVCGCMFGRSTTVCGTVCDSWREHSSGCGGGMYTGAQQGAWQKNEAGWKTLTPDAVGKRPVPMPAARHRCTGMSETNAPAGAPPAVVMSGAARRNPPAEVPAAVPDAAVAPNGAASSVCSARCAAASSAAASAASASTGAAAGSSWTPPAASAPGGHACMPRRPCRSRAVCTAMNRPRTLARPGVYAAPSTTCMHVTASAAAEPPAASWRGPEGSKNAPQGATPVTAASQMSWRALRVHAASAESLEAPSKSSVSGSIAAAQSHRRLRPGAAWRLLHAAAAARTSGARVGVASSPVTVDDVEGSRRSWKVRRKRRWATAAEMGAAMHAAGPGGA